MTSRALAAAASGRRRFLAPGIDRPPPHVYFVVSAVFHYLGPAFAVLLFARIDVLGVAWLRIATAAIIFALWRRPWRVWQESDGGTRRVLLGWGAVLAVMNSCFYIAIDRLPLGTVAAIEFVPLIGLAALAARTKRNGVALLLAVTGVYLLADVRLVAEPVGVAFAAANAVLFALYMVLGHQVAQSDLIRGIDGLAFAMLIGAVVALPIGIRGAVPAFVDPVSLVAAIGVGICSSVVPYVCDQLAMARLTRASYALMVSLFPATATIIGVVVLTQMPTSIETIGVALVIAGVAIHNGREALRCPAVRADQGYTGGAADEKRTFWHAAALHACGSNRMGLQNAALMLTGVEGPEGDIHAENESPHLKESSRGTASPRS